MKITEEQIKAINDALSFCLETTKYNLSNVSKHLICGQMIEADVHPDIVDHFYDILKEYEPSI